MADLFDVNAPIAQEENNSNKNYANEFRPKSKDGQGGVWESVIRFLPNPKNPVDSIASGSTVFLTAPDGRRKEVYCNPNSYQCPITSTFFTLKDNPNPILKERAKTFSKKQRYASLIQVVQCKAHPDLVGKILVWRYGKTVHDKLIQENHPTSEFIQARNPFSIIAGRPFYVKVVQAGGGTPWDNYDQCTFIDPADALAVKCPVQQADGSIVNAPVTAQTLQNPEFKAIVEKWLVESSPSLEQYKYSEWDDETRNFVTDCIKAALNPNSQQNAQQATGIFAGAPQPAAAPVVESVTPITVPQGAPAQPVAPQGGGFASSNIPNLDGILAGGSPSGAAPQPVSPTPQTAPAAPAQPAAPQPAAPQPEAAPAGAPAGGLNLNDILDGIV